MASKDVDGCTALAYHSSTDDPDHTTVLAQNWDWHNEQATNLVHIRIRNSHQSHKAPLLSFVSEAGIIGKIGLNSYGIGTCLNAIRAPGVSFTRLPVHLALRAVLDCDVTKLHRNGVNDHSIRASAAQANAKTGEYPAPSARIAATIIKTAGVASAAHILIADATEGIGLETSFEEMQEVPVTEAGEARMVLHTNHFVVPAHSVQDDRAILPGRSSALLASNRSHPPSQVLLRPT